MAKKETNPQSEKETNRRSRSVASMVLGICSIVLCWTGPIALVLAILAIVFSAKGLGKGSNGRGMAIAGLVTGIVGCVFSFGYTLLWVTAFAIFKAVAENPELLARLNMSLNLTQ